MTPREKAHALRNAIPDGGLFQDKTWRLAPDPLPLPPGMTERIRELGPRLQAFYAASNLLYRQSVEGKQPPWIHRYLDAGKPSSVVDLARERAWKNDLPVVIRPDLLLTEAGLALTELDWVPGGIGLTAWLQEAYGKLEGGLSQNSVAPSPRDLTRRRPGEQPRDRGISEHVGRVRASSQHADG
jgi:hypothetical protein